MRVAPLIAALLAAPFPLAGQMPDTAAAAESRDRVAALDWLVGEWEGSGWIVVPGAGRQEFISSEIVESRLDGRVLVVEGLHRGRVPGVDTAVVVHHALGAITWDADDDRYVFHTWLGTQGGGGVDNALELTEAGFRWMPQASQPGATIVFDVVHQEGAWVETGTVTLADGRSFQVFGMRLSRIR